MIHFVVWYKKVNKKYVDFIMDKNILMVKTVYRYKIKLPIQMQKEN